MQLMQLGEAGILAAVGAAKPQAVQMVGAALGLGAQLGVELPSSADRVAAIQRELPEAKANFVAHQ